MKGKITAIQRMSIHDGPGIRSTIFLKGCNLRCQWCHNPETFAIHDDLEWTQEKCINCGNCLPYCKPQALCLNAGRVQYSKDTCTNCFDCITHCYPEALQRIGKDYSPVELFEEVKQDFTFFKQSEGGITISGGEPMLQYKFVKDALKLFREAKIHTAIETNLNIPWSHYEEILPYTDLFMCDLKLIDSTKHKQWTCAGNERILENIKNLDRTGKPYWLRTPVIPGVNHTIEDISKIAAFVKQLKHIEKYELLPFHPLADSKYKNLGIQNPFNKAEALTQEDLKIYEPIISFV